VAVNVDCVVLDRDAMYICRWLPTFGTPYPFDLKGTLP
jgi:hypothetical protein